MRMKSSEQTLLLPLLPSLVFGGAIVFFTSIENIWCIYVFVPVDLEENWGENIKKKEGRKTEVGLLPKRKSCFFLCVLSSNFVANFLSFSSFFLLENFITTDLTRFATCSRTRSPTTCISWLSSRCFSLRRLRSRSA